MEYERSKYEAKLDIDYAIELHASHIKLYRHIRWLFSLVLLISGSAVFVGAMANDPKLAKITGAAIALLTIVDHLAGLADKVAQHVGLKRQWCELQARTEQLSVSEIDKRISVLRAEDVHIINGLQTPSYNTNLRRHGRGDYVRKLSLWEWLVSSAA